MRGPGAGMLVTLRRCIPRGLVIVDASGAIGAVEMIFPKSLRRAIPGLLESRGLNGKSMQRRLGSPRLSHWEATCHTHRASGEAALHARCRDRMMEGAPVEDISDRFLDAISRLEAVADAVSPHDAHRQLDETSMQVFWRTWPGISSWAGSLWRLLNEELMAAAVRRRARYEEGGRG